MYWVFLLQDITISGQLSGICHRTQEALLWVYSYGAGAPPRRLLLPLSVQWCRGASQHSVYKLIFSLEVPFILIIIYCCLLGTADPSCVYLPLKV